PRPPQTTKTNGPGRRTPRPGTNYPEHDSTESPEHRYQKLASDNPRQRGHRVNMTFNMETIRR
ncbi:hypothetical protein, partial [Corynebacterium tuberculostearicum]